MGRGLMIVLVASLGLNIFAVGFLSGRVLNDERAGPPGPPPGRGAEQSFRLMHYTDALPHERREEFRKAFRTQLPAIRDDFQEMRRLRVELSALLGADEFDRTAVEAKFDALHAIQERQQAAFGNAFLDAFETLTPEEREMLKDAAHDRRGKTRRGHRGEHRKRMRDAPEEGREEG